MSRRTILAALSVILVVVLMLGGMAPTPTQAAKPSSTPTEVPVTMDVTGVIQAITGTQITLTDGTVVKLTHDTTGPTVQVGQTVTITAELDGEDLVAVSITLGSGDDTSDS